MNIGNNCLHGMATHTHTHTRHNNVNSNKEKSLLIETIFHLRWFFYVAGILSYPSIHVFVLDCMRMRSSFQFREEKYSGINAKSSSISRRRFIDLDGMRDSYIQSAQTQRMASIDCTRAFLVYHYHDCSDFVVIV